jgi:hypothetical protein
MLVYALVARCERGPAQQRAVPLAQHAATGFLGNLEAVTLECFNSFEGGDARFSIMCDGWVFNFHVGGGFVVAVVADEAFGRELPFATAKRVSDIFLARFAEKGRAAKAHALQRAFRCVRAAARRAAGAEARFIVGALAAVCPGLLVCLVPSTNHNRHAAAPPCSVC